MRCPFCNQDNTRVVDSRPIEDSNAIRRRRMCDVCGRRFTTYEKEIPSSVIGEKVMHYLKDLDQVAYVRFASIYREFKDVNTFMDELKKMLDK